MPQKLNVEVTAPGVTTITLDRPEVHNAFDELLIAELTAVLQTLAPDPEVRVVVLTGNGESFSAGADLNWMARMSEASEQENRDDALRLALLMRTLAYLPKPTIARINGSAFGGGVGLIACCDVAIAADHAKFGLTEVKLGLVPAVISPYVVDAIGARQARRLFQNAEIFNAATAESIGLVHRQLPADELDAAIAREAKLLIKAGPQAQGAAKALVSAVVGRNAIGQEKLDQSTANLISKLRVSPEGQDGMAAFLEKRNPRWIKDDQ
jgi:methylglutaconyl-CoA hydratase